MSRTLGSKALYLPLLEIGHEKAQSVIDSITNSYAAAGQADANPMLQAPMVGPGFPPPFPLPGAPGGHGMPMPPFGLPPPGRKYHGSITRGSR
jgi:U1 small nuclear ribonucleoprotein C